MITFKEVKGFKIGDKVVVPQQYGYAPMTGYITKIILNSYGVEEALIDYGVEHGFKNKKDWAPLSRLSKFQEKQPEDPAIQELKSALKFGYSAIEEYGKIGEKTPDFIYTKMLETYQKLVDILEQGKEA